MASKTIYNPKTGQSSAIPESELNYWKSQGYSETPISLTDTNKLNGNQSATMDAIPKTINSPAQDFTVNRELLGLGGTAPPQPEYLTELPTSNKVAIKEKTASQAHGQEKAGKAITLQRRTSQICPLFMFS